MVDEATLRPLLEAFLDNLRYARGLTPLTLSAYQSDLETCFAFLKR
jgi:site-specific recombinase XerC